MRFVTLLLISLFWGADSLRAEVVRVFTDTQGRTLEGRVLQVEKKRVQIRREDGYIFWLDNSLLSDGDRKWLQAAFAAENEVVENADSTAVSYKDLNDAFGIPLWQDSQLWDDATSQVGERLKWNLESKTDKLQSYREYPEANARVLGIRPYSLALYGKNGRVSRLSMVFSNQGDLEGVHAYMGNKEIEVLIDSLNERLENEEETISGRLTPLLGEPQRMTFGEGKRLKERVLRWDWGQHSILLSVQENEYVSIRIFSKEVADRKGRAERIRDEAIKSMIRSNVVRSENGDVLVSQIPMVDQGPKGYCVPATFERVLRYFDIPADMYIIAMAGNTGLGGGTYVEDAMEGVAALVKRSGRSLDKKELRLNSTRTIARYIDNGVPLIWTLDSTDDYNRFTNQHSAARKKIEDWERWKVTVKDNCRVAEKLGRDFSSGHACLIVGYNAETDEVAVSDSWGALYELRWTCLSAAEAVSKGQFWVISW